jgi:hypothetical protein
MALIKRPTRTRYLVVAALVAGASTLAGPAVPAQASEACVLVPNGAYTCFDRGDEGAGECPGGAWVGPDNVVHYGPQPERFQNWLFAPSPLIAGRPAVGRTLTVQPCNWVPDPVTLHVQWKRNGRAIPGATGQSYTLTESDQGKAITVTVTGSKAAFASLARTSAPTAVIALAESYVDPPAPEIVVGNSVTSVGTRLYATNTWRYTELSYSHQWKRDGAAVDGATGEEYVLTTADIGHKMTVTRTGWRPGWATVTKSSAQSDVVVAGPPPSFTLPPDTTAPVVAPSLAQGTYLYGQALSLAADETADIFYTTDGSTPTQSSRRYSGPFSLYRTTELRFIGFDLAGNVSAAATQVYSIKPEPVVDSAAPSMSMSLQNGTYLTGQRLEISTDEVAAVYYTTDGSTPTTASSEYSSPLKLEASAAYRFTAVDTSGNSSVPVSRSFVVQTPVFDDIGPGTQFFAEISWLAKEGISTGWDERGSRTYRPVQPVNRDAMAAFMYRLAGYPPFIPPAASPFTDIAPGNQFYKEITWLASTGISTGWDEGNGRRSYRPLQPVNRDAMAAFMYRFAGSPEFGASPLSQFTDVAGSPFYKEISWLADKGISTGYTEPNWTRTYRPLNPVNRDAMAAFMYRLHSAFGTK